MMAEGPSDFPERTHHIHCDFCGTEFRIRKFMEGACPNCGASHDWYEGYAMDSSGLCVRVREKAFEEAAELADSKAREVDEFAEGCGCYMRVEELADKYRTLAKEKPDGC